MSADDREARRVRSAAIFNNRYFADVAATGVAVSEGGTKMFTTRMVASATGLADSVVRPILLRFADARILEKLPKLGGGRSAQYFQVVDVDALVTICELADPRRDPRSMTPPSDQAGA